jgi:hypothetical protein
MVLDGRHLDLLPTSSPSLWVARSNGPDIQAQPQSDGSWLVFDGQGRTYKFTSPAGNDLWVLAQIRDIGGNRVNLSYTVATVVLGNVAALTLDLVDVNYNIRAGDPDNQSCAKTDVALSYFANEPAPMSVATLNSRVLVRMHKLQNITISSTQNCGDANNKTASVLRQYVLTYQPDVDTGQPRLHQIQVVGQEGTSEHVLTPVATYAYGTAKNGNQLKYQSTTSTPGIAWQPPTSISDTSVMPSAGVGYATWNELRDITGDGFPDVIKYTPASDLLAYTDWNNSLTSISLASSALGLKPLDINTLQVARYQYQDTTNVDLVWRQTIDVNGDGRPDVIDAAEQAGHWVVYLNVPNERSPNTPQWVRRSISVQALGQQFSSAGLLSDTTYVPLARHTTARQVTRAICLIWDVTEGWISNPSGFDIHNCDGPEFSYGPEATYTEWEISDINGDGYPDVVFNSTPIATTTHADPIPRPPTNPNRGGAFATVRTTQTPGLSGSNNVVVALNLMGVHLNLDTQPFTLPTALTFGDTCGVARWDSSDATHQQLACTFADVNADGLADRVLGTSVQLGTGISSLMLISSPGCYVARPEAVKSEARCTAVGRS